ncbi:MAG: PAS domain-containing protein [Flavonifractor plautii]
MQLDPITRAVLDAMQEGVLIIDAQERIVYGNRAYVAFLEKEAGGPIGPIEGYPCGCCAPVPGRRRCWLRSAPSCTPRARRARTSTSSTCTPSSTERRWWAACRWLPLEGRLRLPGGAGAL